MLTLMQLKKQQISL